MNEDPGLTPGAEPVVSPRLAREQRTVEAMLAIYCAVHHEADHTLCPGCQSLFEYACVRLQRCPYGDEKPTCANCPIHCYDARRRSWMKDVMGFAGPRMPLRYPILAFRHMRDGRRLAPAAPGRRVSPKLTESAGGR